MVKRTEIVAAVEHLDGLVKTWDRGTEKALSPQVIEAIQGIGDLIQTDDVPEDAYELVLRLDDFFIESDNWIRDYVQARGTDEYVRPSGTDQMWRLWGEVLEAKVPRPKTLPQPAILLLDQKVPTAVICRKYRFVLPDGRPDVLRLNQHLLCERKGEPSPHYDPETFCSTQDEHRAAQWKQRWGDRKKKLADAGISVRSAAKSRGPRPQTATIEDLAHQPHMTIEVLARKCGLTVREAQDQLAAKGLKLDGTGAHFFDPSIAAESERRSKTSDERERTQHLLERYQDHGDDLEALVSTMAADDCKPKTIALVATQLAERVGKPKITYQQVKRLLDQIEEGAAA